MLSSRFDQALIYAIDVHRGQRRKGTGVPYVSHVLIVAGLVLENGGDEDEAIAALLHDAVEDQGGEPRLADIRAKFGDRVAQIVLGVSDTTVMPKPPWEERKRRYLEHLPTAPASERLVSAADKVANARAILANYRDLGDELWPRFNANRDQILWYYRSLVQGFRAAGGPALVDELERVVREIERLTGT
ncbi:MAG: HD domain-containing protein [Bacteroidales bacterium]